MLDKEGNTPLHLAASNDQLSAVQILLMHGANPEAINLLGKKPLDYTKLPELISLLSGK